MIVIMWEMRRIELLCIFSEFQILESEFQFLDFSIAEFDQNFLTRIFGIKNKIKIPLSVGVPEIGTKNQNSQPSVQGVCGNSMTSFCQRLECRKAAMLDRN
jgi:hypothetical protein